MHGEICDIGQSCVSGLLVVVFMESRKLCALAAGDSGGGEC